MARPPIVLPKKLPKKPDIFKKPATQRKRLTRKKVKGVTVPPVDVGVKRKERSSADILREKLGSAQKNGKQIKSEKTTVSISEKTSADILREKLRERKKKPTPTPPPAKLQKGALPPAFPVPRLTGFAFPTPTGKPIPEPKLFVPNKAPILKQTSASVMRAERLLDRADKTRAALKKLGAVNTLLFYENALIPSAKKLVAIDKAIRKEKDPTKLVEKVGLYNKTLAELKTNSKNFLSMFRKAKDILGKKQVEKKKKVKKINPFSSKTDISPLSNEELIGVAVKGVSFLEKFSKDEKKLFLEFLKRSAVLRPVIRIHLRDLKVKLRNFTVSPTASNKQKLIRSIKQIIPTVSKSQQQVSKFQIEHPPTVISELFKPIKKKAKSVVDAFLTTQKILMNELLGTVITLTTPVAKGIAAITPEEGVSVADVTETGKFLRELQKADAIEIGKVIQKQISVVPKKAVEITKDIPVAGKLVEILHELGKPSVFLANVELFGMLDGLFALAGRAATPFFKALEAGDKATAVKLLTKTAKALENPIAKKKVEQVIGLLLKSKKAVKGAGEYLSKTREKPLTKTLLFVKKAGEIPVRGAKLGFLVAGLNALSDPQSFPFRKHLLRSIVDMTMIEGFFRGTPALVKHSFNKAAEFVPLPENLTGFIEKDLKVGLVPEDVAFRKFVEKEVGVSITEKDAPEILSAIKEKYEGRLNEKNDKVEKIVEDFEAAKKKKGANASEVEKEYIAKIDGVMGEMADLFDAIKKDIREEAKKRKPPPKKKIAKPKEEAVKPKEKVAKPKEKEVPIAKPKVEEPKPTEKPVEKAVPKKKAEEVAKAKPEEKKPIEEKAVPAIGEEEVAVPEAGTPEEILGLEKKKEVPIEKQIKTEREIEQAKETKDRIEDELIQPDDIQLFSDRYETAETAEEKKALVEAIKESDNFEENKQAMDSLLPDNVTVYGVAKDASDLSNREGTLGETVYVRPEDVPVRKGSEKYKAVVSKDDVFSVVDGEKGSLLVDNNKITVIERGEDAFPSKGLEERLIEKEEGVMFERRKVDEKEEKKVAKQKAKAKQKPKPKEEKLGARKRRLKEKRVVTEKTSPLKKVTEFVDIVRKKITRKGKPLSPSELIQEIKNILDIRVKVNKRKQTVAIQGQRLETRGRFVTKENLVEIFAGGVQTLAHELGHFLQENFEVFRPEVMPNGVLKEILKSNLLNRTTTRGIEAPFEHFAEFVRLYMLDKRVLEKETPEALRYFERFLDSNPKIKGLMKEFQKTVATLIDASPAEALKISSTPSSFDKIKVSPAKKFVSFILEEFSSETFPFFEISQKMKKAGMLNDLSADPYVLARMYKAIPSAVATFFSFAPFDPTNPIRIKIDKFGKPTAVINRLGKTKPLEEIIRQLKTREEFETFDTYMKYLTFRDRKRADFRTPLDEMMKVVIAEKTKLPEDPLVLDKLIEQKLTERIREIETKHPNLKAVGEDYVNYTKAILFYAHRRGLLTQKEYIAMRTKNPFFSPLWEAVDEQQFFQASKGLVSTSKPIKRTMDVDQLELLHLPNVFDSARRYTRTMIERADRHYIISSIIDSLVHLAKVDKSVRKMFQFEKVGRKFIKQKFSDETIVSAIKKYVMENMEDEARAKRLVSEIKKEFDFIKKTAGEEASPLFVMYSRLLLDTSANDILIRRGEDFYRLRVFDKPLSRAFSSLQPSEMGWFVRSLSNLIRPLRAGVVLSPNFLLRNNIRDSFNASIVTDAGFIPPVITLLDTTAKAMKKSDELSAFYASGAGFSNVFGMGEQYDFFKGKRLGKFAFSAGLYSQLTGFPLKAFQLLERAADISEISTRMAVFQKTIRKAIKENGIEFDKEGRFNPRDARELALKAGFEARDLLDFYDAGRTMRNLNALIPFLNAKVRGLGRLQRALRENPYGTIARISDLTAISTGIYLYNQRGDIRHKYIPQWLKNSHWVIYTGRRMTKEDFDNLSVDEQAKLIQSLTAKVSPDDANAVSKIKNFIGNLARAGIFVIPKPFEVGFMATLFTNFLEFVDRKDRRMLDSTIQSVFTFSDVLNQIPPSLKTPIEIATNYSFFYKGPIIPETLKNLPPKDQYYASTPEVAKRLGKLFNNSVSPIHIDYIGRSFFGTLFGDMEHLLDTFLKTPDQKYTQLYPELARQFPLFKAFIGRSPFGMRSQAVREFFKEKNRLVSVNKGIRNAIRQQDRKRVEEIIQRNPDAFLFFLPQQNNSTLTTANYTSYVLRLINAVQREMTKQNKFIKRELPKLNLSVERKKLLRIRSELAITLLAESGLKFLDLYREALDLNPKGLKGKILDRLSHTSSFTKNQKLILDPVLEKVRKPGEYDELRDILTTR